MRDPKLQFGTPTAVDHPLTGVPYLRPETTQAPQDAGRRRRRGPHRPSEDRTEADDPGRWRSAAPERGAHRWQPAGVHVAGDESSVTLLHPLYLQ